MDQVIAMAKEISALEAWGVVFGVLYLVLAVRQNIWCWPAGLVGTVLSLVLLFERRLYSESALQIFYAAMAFYGWYQWRYGGKGPAGAAVELRVSTWPPRAHVAAIVGTLALTAVVGWLLSTRTDAAFPYLDSFTSIGSIVATYMATKKLLENWLYWFVLDGLGVYVYVARDLNLYAALFVVYLVLIVIGFREWRRAWRNPPAAAA